MSSGDIELIFWEHLEKWRLESIDSIGNLIDSNRRYTRILFSKKPFVNVYNRKKREISSEFNVYIGAETFC